MLDDALQLLCAEPRWNPIAAGTVDLLDELALFLNHASVERVPVVEPLEILGR